MQTTRTLLGVLLVYTLLIVGRAEAASVQYMLDQSNALEDGVDYLLVTISDDQPGQLDFLVETQSALSEIAGDNFGITSFAFNLAPEREISIDSFLLPDNWKVQFNKGMSEAGKFDVRIMGTGQARQDPLQFSILGLGLDDIVHRFASHVAGFETELGGFEERHGFSEGELHGFDMEKGDFEEMHHVSGAFFYGDRLVSQVPVPAAFWLFGTGMLLLGRVATRRRS